MPLYEAVFIVRQDIATHDVQKLTDNLAAVIEVGGGKILKREYWGLRNLAYRINKSRRGHYMMLGIDAPAAAVIEMERKCRLNEDIMRVLTIKVEKISLESSIMMRDNSEDTYTENEAVNA